MDKKSQKQKVISYIRKHGSITSVEAFKALGVTRLSAIIYYLKEDGFKMTPSPKSARTERTGASILKTEDEKQRQKLDSETKAMIVFNLVLLAFTVLLICVGIK